jgi:DNA helicase-2/ATP-dependent DNA helicase PcrA
MEEVEANPALEGMTESQHRAATHGPGRVMLLGVAGSGRTEALARRLAVLTGDGQRVLALSHGHASAERIRTRAEALIEGSFEELSVHTHRDAAERLLREHAEEAGVDPFFESIGAADRLAMLLDRLD